MTQPFAGKVVLITGAGRGAGRAVALEFARQGARVAANDITPINLDETIAAIRSAGGQVQEFIADVSKQMPVESMIDRVLELWGRIDCLINAAGVSPQAGIFALDEWDWRRTLDVNLSAPFFAMQIAGRAMQRQGGGAIVSFVAPLDETFAAGAAFMASKTGLIGLTRQAARELAEDRIRVNAVCPAWPLAGLQMAGDRAAARYAKITQTVLFLCSEAAAQITGQVISIEDDNEEEQ